jgi:hypothetical protein
MCTSVLRRLIIFLRVRCSIPQCTAICFHKTVPVRGPYLKALHSDRQYEITLPVLRNYGPRQLSRYSDSLRVGRFGDRNPVGVRFTATVQIGPGAHLYNGYRFFAEDYKQNRAIPLLSLRAFVACKKGETYLPASTSHVSGFLVSRLQRQAYNFGSGSRLLCLVSAPGRCHPTPQT